MWGCCSLRSAPLVDRLVVVPHDAQIRAELDEPGDQLLLNGGGVLVFVHHDVADRVLQVGAQIDQGFGGWSCRTRWWEQQVHGKAEDLAVAEATPGGRRINTASATRAVRFSGPLGMAYGRRETN